LKLAREFISFFLSVYIRFQKRQQSEEKKTVLELFFAYIASSSSFFFVLIFYLFCLAVIQILRLGEFNSHSLQSAWQAAQMPKNHVSLYYYIKGIFIFLFSILR
jgi:ABC-type phosphate transport system permease subunit